ncbi:MAG: hypothetical protein AB7L66_12625 [Gemmatimonadales bacterium]
MSRIALTLPRPLARPRVLLAPMLAALAVVPAAAQTALGTPFIRSNHLSFYSAQNSRTGGPETTHTFGVVYGHQFGRLGKPTRVAMVLRGSARPFDDAAAGVLDAAASLALSHDVAAVPGLSVGASAGVAVTAWGDDLANTGRANFRYPATVGASYDIRMKRVTLSPFVTGSVARYDFRTYLNDVRQTQSTGWDGYYAIGASARLQEVVITSTRIVSEYGMPIRSRWAFSAGISF